MYLLEDMIDMAIRKGKEWPSAAHRTVAINLCICNPNIKNMGDMSTVVKIVNKIPKTKIKTITVAEIRELLPFHVI